MDRGRRAGMGSMQPVAGFTGRELMLSRGVPRSRDPDDDAEALRLFGELETGPRQAGRRRRYRSRGRISAPEEMPELNLVARRRRRRASSTSP